jgi:hypothetical protein
MPFAEDAQHHLHFNIKSWRTRLGFEPINVSSTSSWPAKLHFPDSKGLFTKHLWIFQGNWQKTNRITQGDIPPMHDDCCPVMEHTAVSRGTIIVLPQPPP